MNEIKLNSGTQRNIQRNLSIRSRTLPSFNNTLPLTRNTGTSLSPFTTKSTSPNNSTCLPVKSESAFHLMRIGWWKFTPSSQTTLSSTATLRISTMGSSVLMSTFSSSIFKPVSFSFSIMSMIWSWIHQLKTAKEMKIKKTLLLWRWSPMKSDLSVITVASTVELSGSITSSEPIPNKFPWSWKMLTQKTLPSPNVPTKWPYAHDVTVTVISLSCSLIMILRNLR